MADQVMRMLVFEAKGNRFVFPDRYVYILGSDQGHVRPDSNAMIFCMLQLRGEVDYTFETIDVPIIDDCFQLEHVPGELKSSQLPGGGTDIMYISGPIFDSCKE
jgi:hypothetical protein